ncbi:hypothetical protein G6F42_012833 [Rhizopus arrhizus]|nr:hypothetical protein G6F42_012833 [Rhizopus arrhizus]
MLLRSGLHYEFTAITTTTSTRNSRKRKSADDELDERPMKKQEILVFQVEPSCSSHLSPPVAPSSSSNPPSPSSSPVSEVPFVREASYASDDTVPHEDSSEGTVALEVDQAGNERGARQVRFNSNVVTYLYEVDDEPRRAADIKYFDRLPDWSE